MIKSWSNKYFPVHCPRKNKNKCQSVDIPRSTLAKECAIGVRVHHFGWACPSARFIRAVDIVSLEWACIFVVVVNRSFWLLLFS